MEGMMLALEERLARAERRSRFALTAVAIGLVGGLTLALARPARTQTAGQQVTAPFQVVSSDGKVLFTVTEGEGTTGPTLRLMTCAGRTGFLASSKDKDGGACVFDRQGYPLVSLQTGGEVRDGAPGGAVLVGHAGHTEVGLRTGADGGGLYVGRSRDGKWVADVTATDQGGMFEALNGEGKPRACLYSGSNGSGHVTVADAAGKGAVLLGTRKDTGYVSTFDTTGKITFAAPLSPPSPSGFSEQP